MKLSATAQALVKAFAEFEIIDGHEHLLPEHERTSQPVDALTLFAHYTRVDLVSSGMTQDHYLALGNTNLPLDYRWGLLKPFVERVRYGSYARPIFIAARDLFGFDDINDDTYQPLSAAMQANNTPGLYHRLLREKCKIRHGLVQHWRTDYDLDLLIPIMPSDYYAWITTWEQIATRAHELSERVASIDDYIAIAEKGILKWKSEGVVGLKLISQPYGTPNREEAITAFNQLQSGAVAELPAANPIREYVTEQIMRLAAQHDLVVAAHAGMWEDFRDMSVDHLIPFIRRNPQTKFDLYHMGMPQVRSTLVVGKNHANVWLNLCWTHIISPAMTRSGLDECLDLVPINKITAFGGDYVLPVEKVWGHLVMARENIAMVFGARVDAGLMTEAQAIAIARKWFFDNPKELYKLS